MIRQTLERICNCDNLFEELVCPVSSKNIQCSVCSKNLINSFILLLFAIGVILSLSTAQAKCYAIWYSLLSFVDIHDWEKFSLQLNLFEYTLPNAA